MNALRKYGRHDRFDDRGSASVQMAVLTPAILIVLCVVIAAGRISSSSQTIDHVATTAARAASLARTPDQARVDADTTARHTLSQQGIHCGSTTVEVDTSGFSVPVGHNATVTVEVTCVVSLADLAIPGLPGSRELKASFTSPLDPYRGRT